MSKTIQRMEKDGLYTSDPETWQFWETTIYIYPDPRSPKVLRASVTVPVDIQRFLNLKHRDKILLAIKKAET